MVRAGDGASFILDDVPDSCPDAQRMARGSCLCRGLRAPSAARATAARDHHCATAHVGTIRRCSAATGTAARGSCADHRQPAAHAPSDDGYLSLVFLSDCVRRAVRRRRDGLRVPHGAWRPHLT